MDTIDITDRVKYFHEIFVIYHIDIAIIFSGYTPERYSSKYRSALNAVCWYCRFLQKNGAHNIWYDRPILEKRCCRV